MSADSNGGSGESHFSAALRQAVARWLKAKREAASKTQRNAGDFLGVDSQTVSNWETAKHPIDVEDLLRLASYYGADVGELQASDEQRRVMADFEEGAAPLQQKAEEKNREKPGPVKKTGRRR